MGIDDNIICKMDPDLEKSSPRSLDDEPPRSSQSTSRSKSGGEQARHSRNSKQENDIESNSSSVPVTGPPRRQSGNDDTEERFLVKFEDGDPQNPLNWNKYFKAYLTFVLGLLALSGSVGSSIMSPAQADLAKEFKVGSQVTVLTLSLFVLGTWFS